MANNWEPRVFSDLCDITRGASPRPINDWIVEKGIPWVKIADATSSDSRYISKTKECIKTEGISKSVEVFPEDFILSNSATPGIPRIMKINACIHDGWLLLRNFRDLDKRFCYYLLLNERPNLVQLGNGSIFTNLKTDILKNHIVAIPPLPEQRAIADVLSALDDKIDLNRRMNRTLESLAQAIFKHMFIDNPEREIWEVGSLGDDFNLTMGQSPPGSTYNEIGTGLPFFQGRADFGLRYPSNRVYCTAPTRFADTGDTLVCVRAPVGDVNVAFEKCAIGRGLAAIRHKSGSRSYTFYMMQFLEPEFKNFELEGTVFGSINKDSFLSLKIPLPPHNLIEKFEEICYPVDQKIELNNRESRNLAELRDTLLPKLMSGQVRVKI